jgi:UDP-N-acetylglucosamine 2-epimerase (non-hydrolysing)
MLLIIAGTRPELIKLYSVIKSLEADKIPYYLLLTNQQADLANEALNSMNLKADSILVNVINDSSINFIKESIVEISALISRLNPTAIIVHGDTYTTLVGSLAAFIKQIPLVHVEAGLRTWSLSNPWPEEGIRRISDSVSNILFVPNEQDAKNLQLASDQEIYVVGNSGVDIVKKLGKTIDSTFRFSQKPRKVILTFHRRESQGEVMKRIGKEIIDFMKVNSDMYEITLFSHPNPETRKSLKELISSGFVCVKNPSEYANFIDALSQSWLCITDSGGVLLETVTLGVPTAVIRDYVETDISTSPAVLFGRNPGVVDQIFKYFSNSSVYLEHAVPSPLFGDGFSGEKISNIIKTKYYS